MVSGAMTRNEAAERLRAMIDGWAQRDDIRQAGWDRLDEAIAAERRATVERIREAWDQRHVKPEWMDGVQRILDQEATR